MKFTWERIPRSREHRRVSKDKEEKKATNVLPGDREVARSVGKSGCCSFGGPRFSF